METVLSGIRPTGNIHLGNYFGAIKNWTKMQHEHNCFFFIADYHSLTTHPNPKDLNKNVRTTLIELLACGLDPEICTIYSQSDVPETTELYLMLNMLAYKGELERGTSYKEKVAKQEKNVNAGLLTYPVLMAADILIHRSTKVPVGKDQEQHLEMTRTFAKRFNNLYDEIFPEPQAFNFGEKLVKIPGLDGSSKMGKSEGGGNAIFFVDEPELITKKVMKAVTDSGPTELNQEKPEVIRNLFMLMEVVSSAETLASFDKQWADTSIRYGDMKKQLAVDMVSFTEPFRKKIKEIAADETYLKKVIKLGAEKARESAGETIKLARKAIGLN